MPWLGYFEMAHRAHVFVMLDDVQYIRREWINRNKILSASEEGWQWIVIPVKKHKQESLISEIEICNSENWHESILKTIHFVYARSPYYHNYIKQVREILMVTWHRLVDLNIAVIRMFYSILGIKDNLKLSSEFNFKSKKDDRLVDICTYLDANIYLANNGSKPYIDISKFYRKNIGFIYQDYQHPEYLVKRYKFVPYLSVLDLLFWHGPDSLEIILKGRKKDWKNEITYCN